MIQVKPKSQTRKFIKKSAKVFLVVEFVLFAGSYLLWNRMNTNQEFRGYMHKSYPSILEGFYKAGEFLDPEALKRLREIDAAVWAAQASKSE